MRQPILLGPLPPPHGGVATFVKALAEGSEGTDIKVWAYGKGEFGNSRITQFDPRKFGIAKLILTQGRNARITDNSHFHLEYPNPALLPVWLAFKTLAGFEWVKVVHDGSLPARYPLFSPTQRRLFQRAISAVTHFVAVSEEISRWLRDEIKVSQRIDVIPPLLPPRDPLPLTAALRDQISGFIAHDFRVVSSGAFIPTYGFDHIVEALERIRGESAIDTGLLLIDANFARDEEFRRKVLSNRDWITVLEGVDNRYVSAILKESSLFLRGFGLESFGISRIEALWAGVPVIATTAGETRGMNTYNFGDVDELTARIRKVLAGGVVADAGLCAEQFREEARANLRAYLQVIRGTS